MADQPETQYDLAIIGSGAAGYTASIYASRYNVSNIIIGEQVGGQTAEAHLIQNFPSYVEIKGSELMQKIADHAKAYGTEIVFDTVTDISGSVGDFILKTSGSKEFRAKAVLLAIGTKRRRLGIPREEEFFGKGLTYCATCDAMFYQDKIAAVVGGSDSANTASLYLAEIATKVYQIYRKDKLRGEPAWADKVASNPKIEVLYNTNVVGLEGESKLEAVILDKEHNGNKRLETDGLFVEIGSEPDTSLMKQLGLKTDESGYIVTGPDQTTSVPGIWAAGDITTNSNQFRQTITAASEGAIAAQSVFTSLQSE